MEELDHLRRRWGGSDVAGLHLVEPDKVHVMYEGRIVKDGGPELVGELEDKGYGWIKEEVEATA